MARRPRPVGSAHTRFHDQYITSSEICEILGISRMALMQARKRHDTALPDAIEIRRPKLFLWERAVALPIVHEWKKTLDAKRGVTANGNSTKPRA